MTADDGDASNNIGSDSITVAVANLPPVVVLSGPNSANEGETKTYTYTVTDPGQDPSPTITEECGANGTYVPTATANHFQCTFPDGPASSIVKVTADDGDASNNIGSDSITVAVANLPPVVVLSGPNSANEGETKTYTYTVTDPGQDPSPTITEECGANGTYVPTATANHFQCTFPDGPASSIVKVTADDGDASNNIGSDSITVAVANLPPVVVLSGPNSANEGETKTYTYTVTDPGQDPSPTITEECGANGTYVPTATANHFQCTFPDGPASSIVKVTADDGDASNNIGSDSKSVTVNNVPPSLTITAPAYGQIYPANNATVTFRGSFTDPGTGDTHTCSASWDDGTPNSAGVVVEANGSGSCTATHTYTAPGVYTISMTVTDDDGASDTESWLVVVYDPGGGFVTGGGWINSPAGAYRPDPSLAGRANFGFVSKYKKGASVPEGQTEFQFQTGNLNFHSEIYQWLVVAGNKAQFKGTGTINGNGSYGFLLTAYDGSPDRFRIKITGSSGVVYDNKFGSSDDIDGADPQAISDGSIVVHKG